MVFGTGTTGATYKKGKAWRRVTAILVVLVFTLFDAGRYAPQGYASPAAPIADPAPTSFSIPKELGKVEESFRGTTDKTVIFIQDAHDSLEAQENISKIIEHLVSTQGVKTVLEEGYEGPVPTDEYFGFIKDSELRRKVAYFFLDHLRVGGAEYAHINRTKDFKLIGADSIKLHRANIDQYRLSSEKKEAITHDLKALGAEVQILANKRFSKELLEWLKLKERFDTKKIDLLDYLGRTMKLLAQKDALSGDRLALLRFLLEARSSNDPNVMEKVRHIDAREVYAELIKLEEAMGEVYLKDATDKELFGYCKILGLLKRLNDLQVTQEEYEAVKTTLKTFNTESLGLFTHKNTRKPLVLSRQWERNVQDAVRFYEIAKSRDHAMETQLDSFINNPAESTAVLVFGGFHKEDIKRILEAKGIRYVVVTPRITQPSPRHEEFYKRLMTHGRLSYELPANLSTATRAESRIEVWNGNIQLARAEIGIMTSVIRDMPNADAQSLGLAVEQAMNAFKSRSVMRSEMRGSELTDEQKQMLDPSTVSDPEERRELSEMFRIINSHGSYHYVWQLPESMGEESMYSFEYTVRDITVRLKKLYGKMRNKISDPQCRIKVMELYKNILEEGKLYDWDYLEWIIANEEFVNKSLPQEREIIAEIIRSISRKHYWGYQEPHKNEYIALRFVLSQWFWALNYERRMEILNIFRGGIVDCDAEKASNFALSLWLGTLNLKRRIKISNIFKAPIPDSILRSFLYQEITMPPEIFELFMLTGVLDQEHLDYPALMNSVSVSTGSREFSEILQTFSRENDAAETESDRIVAAKKAYQNILLLAKQLEAPKARSNWTTDGSQRTEAQPDETDLWMKKPDDKKRSEMRETARLKTEDYRPPAVKDLSDEIESKLGIDTHGKLTEFIERMLGVIPTIHDFDSFVLSQRDPFNTLIQQYGVHLNHEEVEQILIRLLRWSFNLGFIDIDQLGWFKELNLDHPTIVITTRAQGGLGDITKIDLLIRGMKREFEKLKVSDAKFRVLIFDEDKEKMAILKNREYPDVDFIFLPSSEPIPENSSYLRDADVFVSLDRAVTDEVSFDSKDEGHLPSALVYTTLGQYDRPVPRNPRYKRVKISEIPTGFQHGSAGFLISPFYEELYQSRLGLTEDQKLAEKEHLLAQVIHEILPTQEVSQDQLTQAARSSWGLVYMHEQGMDYLKGIAEYQRTHEPDQSVTLFTLLGETNVWYKGTKEWEGLVSKIRAAGLPVETYDLSHDPKAIQNIDFKKPVVRVLNVGMHALELYVHLMAASDLPAGVTGNESLLTALLLRKRFLYEVATWERTLFLNMLSDMKKILGEESIAASSVEGNRLGDISAGNAVKFWRGDLGLIEEFKQFGDSVAGRELYPQVVRKILRSSAFIRFLDKRDKRTDRAMTSKPHVQEVVRHAGLEANGLGEYFPSFDLFRKASDHESGIIARVKEVLNNHFSLQQLKQDGDFLDVGASDGVIAEALMPYFKHGVAVEIDENVSERLKSKEIHGLDVVTVPIQEYAPNHKFDVILVSHSLYYIEEKDRMNQIKRMASWLKPRGRLIISYTVHGDSQNDLSRMKKALGVPSKAIDGRAINAGLISEGFEASLEILESAVTADLDGMLKIAPFVLKKSSTQAATIRAQIQEYIERNLWDEARRNYRLNIPQELLIISSGSGGHNENALDGLQSDGRSEMRDKEHVALYSFGSRDAIESDQDVLLRYSAYKYGGQEQSDYFLGMLHAEILKKFGAQINSNPGQWVLATTGYSMSKPSIVPLARKLSAKLGIEYVSVRAVRKNRKSGKPLIYADLKTSEAREAVQEMYEYCLESDQSYEGKNVIFIDDFFASGSALKKINTILVNKYQMRIAGNFVIISIASMETKDPAVEDEINSFLIRSKPLEEIAKLLNRKDTTITRYTVTSLFQMEMPKFRALVALLNDFFLSKLFIVAIQNHRDAVDVEKIKIINDRIRASSLNRETLISHLKQQNGGLVLLGGPSGAGKATEADSLKESLGSPVLPVDFYPSDQGATKYGTKSHELFISHNNALVWADISQLLQGKGVSVTSPYYYEHQFTRIINPPLNKPLIVDGLHAVNPDFVEGLPKSVPITKVFVDAPKQIRFLRRLLTISGETNYAAALMMWRNVIEAEEESIDLSRNNADFILVEPEDPVEIQRLVKDTATIRASLRDYLAGLDERDDSRIVLKGILDDVESFIEERGIYYNLNKSLQDQADSIRSKRKGLKVGILGGSKPSQEYLVADGEELGRSLANYLRPIHGVAFTGGDSGVGADFYRGYCSLETSKDEFFALLPIGAGPNEEYERMSSNNLSIERLGTRFSVRNIGMALVGDVFIAMNGGSGTMQEVTEVLKRGKPVVALNYGGVGTILYQAKISGKIPQVLQDNGIDENALKFIIPGDISNISQALERARELMSDHATDVTALPNPSSTLLSNIESVANQAAADMERDAKPEDQRIISEINNRIQIALQTLKLRADKGSFIVGNLEDLLHGQEKLMEGLRKAPPVIVEFPGTFDPPHFNHVQRMLEVLVGVSDTAEPRTYYAVFSPIGDRFDGDGDSGNSWKPNKLPFEHRYQMTKLLSDIFSPLLSAIDVSRDSTQNKGVIDLLTPVLASDIKPLTNFYTITGADNLEHLETYIAKDLSAVPPGIRKHFAILDDSDHPDVIARLSSTYPDNVVVVDVYSNLNGVRSTEIRTKQRIGVLPFSMQKYIQENSLYGTVAQERAQSRSETRSSNLNTPSLKITVPAVVVIEKGQLEAMSRAELRQFMGFATINRAELRLVVPDMPEGMESRFLADLRKLGVRVSLDLPGVDANVRVIGFSDKERDTAGQFRNRLGRRSSRLAGGVKEYFALEGGEGIFLALLVARPEDLSVKNGFRYDKSGRYQAELRAILQNLMTSYFVISSAA